MCFSVRNHSQFCVLDIKDQPIQPNDYLPAAPSPFPATASAFIMLRRPALFMLVVRLTWSARQMCVYERERERGRRRRGRRRRRGGGRRRRRGRKGRKEERKKKKKGKKKKGKKKIKEMGHPPESRVRPLMTSHTIPPSPWVGSRASRLHVIDRVRQLHTIE